MGGSDFALSDESDLEVCHEDTTVAHARATGRAWYNFKGDQVLIYLPV
jgi:hypothetical protein